MKGQINTKQAGLIGSLPALMIATLFVIVIVALLLASVSVNKLAERRTGIMFYDEGKLGLDNIYSYATTQLTKRTNILSQRHGSKTITELAKEENYEP